MGLLAFHHLVVDSDQKAAQHYLRLLRGNFRSALTIECGYGPLPLLLRYVPSAFVEVRHRRLLA